MKLRTRLRLFAALPAAFVIVIAVVLWATGSRVDEMRRQASVAHAVIQADNELNLLVQEYLLYREPRAVAQWHARHASFGKLIAQLRAALPAEGALIAEIRQDDAEMARLFNDIVARPPELPVADWRQRAVSQLMIRSEGVRSRAQQLADSKDQHVRALEEWADAAILGLLVILVALGVPISVLLIRQLNRSIESLLHGVSRIGAGELAHEISIDGSDELGELAKAVNGMSRQLAQYRDHLEELVLQRTAELEEANSRLKELDRLKSMFIASMSHELRTPLNSIIGFTGIILQGLAGAINDEQRKQLGMVTESANHLLALINDVIDVSKIEAGMVELSIEEFDLAALAREVADSLARMAQQKALSLFVEAPESLFISSDRRRVRQILVNLIDNGLKFTDRGQLAIRVIRRDGGVDIEVRDTGIGIAPEAMSKLFVPFSRITTKGRLVEGSGLGLYLSQRVAAVLGGSISARSEPGKGSVFTLWLNAIPKPVTGPAAAPSS